MRVEELMTRDLVTIDKNRKLSDVLTLMEKCRVSRVVVTNSGKACGIVTEKDIAEHLGTSRHGKSLPSSLHVSTAMSTGLVTIKKGADVRDGVELMLEKGISSLLVVNGSEPVGIITKTDILRCLTDSETTLGEIMKRDPLTVPPNKRIVHARRLMLDRHISRVIVAEEEGVVGVMTERDAAKALYAFRKTADKHQYNRVRNLLVGDVMTQDVFCMGTSDTAGEAAKAMLEKRFSGIPILEREKLVGIVTKTDLMKLLL